MVAASRRHPSSFLTKCTLSVFDPSTGHYLEHCQLRRHPQLGPIWESVHSNEIVRLCQGVVKGPTRTEQCTKGTDTFCFICFEIIPRHRHKGTTFTKVVCKFRPEKEDLNCTRITIMGNRVVYAGDDGTKTASIDLCILVTNSVLSQKGAKFTTYNIRNYYLVTLLDYPEYLKIKLTDILQEFID